MTAVYLLGMAAWLVIVGGQQASEPEHRQGGLFLATVLLGLIWPACLLWVIGQAISERWAK